MLIFYDKKANLDDLQSCADVTLSLIKDNVELKAWYSSFGFVHAHTVKYNCFLFICGYMEMHIK